MTVAACVVALLAAVLHVAIWFMESIAWRRPATWRRFAVTDQAAADTIAPMAHNQGFYNLFLAAVTAVGVALLAADRAGPGWALLLAGTGSMLGAAVVLVSSGRRYLRPALTQGTLPALAVVLGLSALLG